MSWTPENVIALMVGIPSVLLATAALVKAFKTDGTVSAQGNRIEAQSSNARDLRTSLNNLATNSVPASIVAAAMSQQSPSTIVTGTGDVNRGEGATAEAKSLGEYDEQELIDAIIKLRGGREKPAPPRSVLPDTEEEAA